MSNFRMEHDAYAGDITPEEAWEILKNDSKAQIVDVRTVPEWAFVGCPDVSSLKKKLIRICWRVYPQMIVNQDFEQQLEREVPDRDVTLLFICRSGARSQDAAIAMTAKGYGTCYNIAGGFEGDLDAGSHRGTRNCWKSANLPWEQN